MSQQSSLDVWSKEILCDMNMYEGNFWNVLWDKEFLETFYISITGKMNMSNVVEPIRSPFK